MFTYKQLNNLPYAGRLGNQMHEIASVSGIAKDHNVKAMFPYWHYSEYFKNFTDTVFQLPDPDTNEYNIIHYEGVLFQNYKLDITHNYDFKGYFQNERYWINHQDYIKHIFTPGFETNNAIKDMVAIHIRRGDYLERKNFHTPLFETGYYKKAITLFPPETRFAIFSDDIGWCKNNFDPERFTFVIPSSDYLDLFYMATCKGFIIANSSYSWWGARLHELLHGECRVIAPKQWYTYQITDCCPDRWTLI